MVDRTVWLERVAWQVREFQDHPERWILLNGNRLVVAGGLLLCLFGFVWAFVLAGFITTGDPTGVAPLFRQLISGNLTLIALVLSINQLVLSRELNAPGEFRERMRNITAFRDDVREEVERTTLPTEPSKFLRVFVQYVRQEGQRLGGLVADGGDEECSREVEILVTTLTRQMDAIYVLLDRPEVNVFTALSAMLSSNHADHIRHLNRIESRYGDGLSDETLDSLDRVRDLLYQFNVAREYLKTIFMQTELATLSRMLLYVGVPAEAVVAVAFFVLNTPVAPGERGVSAVFVVAAFTLGVAPLAVLFAYVLRISVVAQETVATTPFETLRRFGDRARETETQQEPRLEPESKSKPKSRSESGRR